MNKQYFFQLVQNFENSKFGKKNLGNHGVKLLTEQFVKAWKDENAKMRIQRNHFTPFVTCIKIQALESIQKLNFRLCIQTKIVFFSKIVPGVLTYCEKKLF